MDIVLALLYFVIVIYQSTEEFRLYPSVLRYLHIGKEPNTNELR